MASPDMDFTWTEPMVQLAGFIPQDQDEVLDLADEVASLSGEVERLRTELRQKQAEQDRTVRAQLAMDVLLVIGIAILTVVLFRI